MTRAYTRRADRAEPREELRPPPRDPDRVRTRKRKGDTDDFWIDVEKKPDEQDWNWKRFETYGEEDIPNQRLAAENGWEPVDASVFGDGRTGLVQHGGMVLCERPIELTMEARQEESAKARDMVRNQERKAVSEFTPEDPAERAMTRSHVKRSEPRPLDIAE